jgi:hypothetical protein
MNKKPSPEDIEELIRKQRAETLREGFHQEKHPNGRLFREWTVVGGKIDGVMREWHENGTLILEEPMKQGVVHGIVKQWNSKGEFLGEYKMKMGRGIERKWDEDGILVSELERLGKNAIWGKVYDDLGNARVIYLWNGKSISEKKFNERLGRQGDDSTSS